jgi:hypothetical protein
MTVKPTLALEWEFGKQLVVLDGLSDHDLEPMEEIWEGIDGWTYDESVQPLGERIYLHVHLGLSLQLIDASFLRNTGRFILTTRKIPNL